MFDREAKMYYRTYIQDECFIFGKGCASKKHEFQKHFKAKQNQQFLQSIELSFQIHSVQ